MNHESESYKEYRRLLILLHCAMRDGKSETAEADLIRDEMDAPWYKLTPTEIASLDGLSVDLYTLEPDSPIAHPQSGGISSLELARQLQIARANKAYDQILSLLRLQPECISADRAAFLRGWCYEGLGDNEIAAMFYDHARKLDQRNDLYAVFTLGVPTLPPVALEAH